MEDNSKLKQAKIWRLSLRIAFAVVAFVLPLVIVSTKYKLITEFSGYKLTAVGVILGVVVLWRFKGTIMEWVNSWEYSIMKYILIGFSRVYIFLIIVAILLMARQGLENLIFCIEWICLCECIAYLILYPAEQKFDYQVKRILRGIERKQDYKEAIKELSEGTN
jgi:membrane protease YdiL (CAAX protease family)